MTISIENKILQLLISGINIWRQKTRRKGQFGFPGNTNSAAVVPDANFIITQDDRFLITESSNFLITE